MRFLRNTCASYDRSRAFFYVFYVSISNIVCVFNILYKRMQSTNQELSNANWIIMDSAITSN